MSARKSHWFFLGILAILALVLSACTAATPTATEEAAPTEAAASPTEAPAEPTEAPSTEADFAVNPGGFLERAMAGEFTGTTVTVDGPFTEPDDLYFDQSMDAFEEATGITVNYIGDKEFESRISVAVDAGTPPDIADFPQPGLLASFVRQGDVVDPTTYIPEEWLTQQYNQSWLDMATMEGQTAGVWHRYNGKSLVWYPKAVFDEAGYQVPETWDELVALTEQIAADGDAPWCIGIESQAATGWPATDWTEDLMLRTTSLENYDAWVAGELPFSSPEVKNAIETWSEIWLNPDYVLGGTDGIVSTYFGDAPAPMFEDPPQCWLHRQGNFITGFFPEGTVAGEDYDFFYLPPVDDAYGRPFLVAGDIMAQFADRPEVNALMEYFTVPESASVWLANGGALAAHQTTPLEMYSEGLRGIAELAAAATSFRFDASDLMPGAVGSGSFWTGITNYVSGLTDLDTALADIDASWPADTTGAEGPSEPAQEGPFAVNPGGFLERAMAGEFTGTTVTVDGPFTEPDDLYFDQSMDAFEEATGITVNYIGDKEFESRISVAVDAGTPPDIADFPQPGLLASFVRQGDVVDPTTYIPEEWLTQQYNQSWLDMATMEGQTAGVWHRYNGKSLVWYPKAVFDEAGYQVPETWDELVALTEQIAADGDAPWCIGIESQAATGWPATDWTEDLMLRTTSLENYDAWVAGELPFSSPEVKNAIETWSEIWLNPDYVLGGTDGIVSTYFGDAPAPMFEDPPQCWLHRQGNFITGFFPEGTVAGEDYDFFYLPPVDDAYGRPFLVAGDIMAQFADRPEVNALMEYFTVPESASVWLANGGALAAHQTTPLEMYSEGLRGIAELAAAATSFRFDASDLMPGAVGSGSFWTGITNYVSGLTDLDTALADIDASWPQ